MTLSSKNTFFHERTMFLYSLQMSEEKETKCSIMCNLWQPKWMHQLTFSFHAHSPIPRNAIPKNWKKEKKKVLSVRVNAMFLLTQIQIKFSTNSFVTLPCWEILLSKMWVTAFDRKRNTIITLIKIKHEERVKKRWYRNQP